MFESVRAGGGEEECTLDEVAYEPDLDYAERYTLDCEGTLTGGSHVVCFEPEAVDLMACDVEP
jgi:hypothetical protein